MTLLFATQINGKPTYFVEKIWHGLKQQNLIHNLEKLEHYDRRYFELFGNTPFDYDKTFSAKIHTIRIDKSNRWECGKMIDFSIWTGRPYRSKIFQFAPRLPVVSVQEVFTTFYQGRFEVSIDDKYLNDYTIEKLAINDGFNSYEDFRDYFIQEMQDNQYSVKIIHWTNFKY